jgi:hypothetical protein
MSWGPVTLSIGALSRMLRAQRLGDPHRVLYQHAVWTDEDSDAAMWAEFDKIGWLRRDGRLHGDAHDRLAMLARPFVEYAGWFVEKPDRRSSALVASIGNDAVVVFRDGDIVELRGQLPNETPNMAFMRQVPDGRPASIDALNIRLDGGYGADAQKLRALVKTGRTGHGELYVGLRDQHYEYRSNTDNPVRYDDYPIGRVLVSIAAGYVSIAPATKVLLRRRLDAIYRELART